MHCCHSKYLSWSTPHIPLLLENFVSYYSVGFPLTSEHHGAGVDTTSVAHMAPLPLALAMVKNVWIGWGKEVNVVSTVRALIIYLERTII